MADNFLPFSLPHRGDPDPRRMALASIGFQWRWGQWRRGRVILTDAEIDQMDPKRWAQGRQIYRTHLGSPADWTLYQTVLDTIARLCPDVIAAVQE